MFDVFYIGIKPNLFPHEQAATDIDDARSKSRTRYCWVVNYLIDYKDFDFLWEPVPWQNQYTHAWPSVWPEFHAAYLVPKNNENIEFHFHKNTLPAKNHLENYQKLFPCEFDSNWLPDPFDPPYIYVFGNQWHRAEVMPTVEYHMPGATERKFMHWPRAVLSVDMTNWVVPPDIDTSDFDFSWVPDPGSPPYVYQFGTQHQRTGGPQYIVPGATDVKYVTQIKAKTSSKATAIIEIDHLDGNAGAIHNVTKTSRYFDNYLDTLKRIANNISNEHEFVWICSSICDYSNFDFTWHPEQWQATMLHVFASDGEKFGDTFFMHVPSFKLNSERCQLLEWYDLNFVEGASVPRRALPIVKHDNDTQVDAVKTMSWKGPLAIFTNGSIPTQVPCVPLWREKVKTITTLTSGHSEVIVPKVAVPYIRTQLYDYPYIDKTHCNKKDDPLHVVFIENGESNAAENWNILRRALTSLPNPVSKISNVNGRVAAYQAAAEASSTDWFFAVFAKLEVLSIFPWDWQPDRMQAAKHYIFHARNPVNGLEYGHMSMIAYNRRLTLSNTGQGLDFTLDQEHEVVPLLSGIARYNSDPWMSWRTAFRECLKLKSSIDIESQYRLDQWLTKGNDINGEWSVFGAQDAVEYYDQVGGNFDELKKSYEWDWLKSYALFKRPELLTHSKT